MKWIAQFLFVCLFYFPRAALLCILLPYKTFAAILSTCWGFFCLIVITFICKNNMENNEASFRYIYTFVHC